ncbi:putative aspartic-type endopeptidase opsB [Cladophialophora carrionii]|uniref:Probable aspartic-type endopeptidase OPSB n=1 Tax=Cladophialophora carrionii TaxID=86049 RepID=A0A1C1CQB0_9EURO|nr:putative aspartic-type endopeptidase opsB [Cladophialophora carrionii]
MKPSPAVVAVAAALSAPLVSAIHLAPRSEASPRTLSLPIERRHVPDILAHERARLRKRQTSGTVEQTLDNDQSLYYANITLGTPAQSLRLHIDTGSSDLWANTASSSFCLARTDNCEGGTYSSAQSSTYRLVNDLFNISYVDGSAAVGDYVTDTLGFGGVTLTDFQFGIGEVSSSSQGVLGIGYMSNEVQVQRANLDPYPNLPQALVDAGHIASNAYSLWLNDLDASTGEILFGGVNTEKYEGELATLPILSEGGEYFELSLALTGVTNAGSDLSSSSSFPTAVLLDSGATLTYLPNDITQEIYNSVQAVYQSDVGAAYAPCALASSSATIDYSFSGVTIKVPYNELFLSAGTNNFGQPITFTNGEEACLFGIAPAQSGMAVLGDTFLRSAYVVYDLSNNEISLAQTVFNSTTDNIQMITKGDNGVPNATPVFDPVGDVSATTGGARLGDSSATANPFNAGSKDKQASSMGAMVAAVFAIAATFVLS